MTAAGSLDSARAGVPVVVARQPILDRDEVIRGYELLYRPTGSGAVAPGGDGYSATSTVIVRALADIGLDALVGDRKAWVNVTREFLLEVRPLPLPPERTVIELLEGQAVDDELLEVLGELRAAGFRVALDDFRFDPGWAALVEHADAIKLDIRELPRAALEEAVERLRRPGLYLLAEKVETRAEYEHCRALGFDAFQGYFFAEPLLVEGGAVPTHQLAGLASMAQAGDGVTFEELERLISQDAGLAYKLVRFANSAFVGSRSAVSSVRGALTLMGTINVRRWSMLLALAGITDRPQHLLATGLLRARQCELLARRPVDPAVAFTVGLFSILPALAGTTMEALVGGLPFDAAVSGALLEQAGEEGALLAGVLAFERGDFEACESHGTDLLEVAEVYRAALAWVEQSAPHLA
jgi:EAL and modified HD-GYP domain-containing signal transduction protein